MITKRGQDDYNKILNDPEAHREYIRNKVNELMQDPSTTYKWVGVGETCQSKDPNYQLMHKRYLDSNQHGLIMRRGDTLYPVPIADESYNQYRWSIPSYDDKPRFTWIGKDVNRKDLSPKEKKLNKLMKRYGINGVAVTFPGGHVPDGLKV